VKVIQQTKHSSTWQIVVLVVESGQKQTCECGELALYIKLFDSERGEDDMGYGAYCRECWRREYGKGSK
jgi:hypothetical protein